MADRTSYFLDTLPFKKGDGGRDFFMASRNKYFVFLVLLGDKLVGTQALLWQPNRFCVGGKKPHTNENNLFLSLIRQITRCSFWDSSGVKRSRKCPWRQIDISLCSWAIAIQLSKPIIQRLNRGRKVKCVLFLIQNMPFSKGNV